MKLFVITSPDAVDNEIEILISLLENGLEVLHVRKPEWDIKQYEEFIKKIPFTYYKRIVLHSHFKLSEKYNVKGIHLTSIYRKGIDAEKIKELINIASKRNLTVSTSFHSLEEVEQNKLKFTYAFLSPVFDSISKRGYQASFNKNELKAYLSSYAKGTKVVALGGVDEVTIKEVRDMNFSGAAVLGVVWGRSGNELNAFNKIKGVLHNE